MKIKLDYAITGEKLANYSMFLIILIICFPLTMLLPSMIRMPIQILAVLLFVLALLLMNRTGYIVMLFLLFGCSYLYYIGTWEEMMEGSTFLYNSLCCWIISLYAMLCIDGCIKNNKKIFWLVVILTLFTAITTIIGLKQFPLAVRELGRGSSYAGTDVKLIYRSRNIASWSQVYGMVFFQGVFTYYYKETKNKLVLLTIVVTEMCILSSQLTFGILLSFVTLVLIITNRRSKKYYIIVFTVFIVALIAYFNRESIMLCAIGFSRRYEFEMLTPKLRDLYNLLIYKAVTGDASARFDLFTKSLSTFTNFPFGLFWYRDIQATNYIGYHSELFDIIGGLGILGIFIVIGGSYAWLHKIKKVEDGYIYRFLLYMFAVFGMIFFFNPVFYSPQIWVSVFALPALITCNCPNNKRCLKVSI